eukprot:GHVU01232788.1.p1 GENE.GHVU01232788.1~~GHVU01232788.1.p1  ORF type:complete len:176 (+),score=21.29 GHVU01232788.1:1009-1536(+)
MQGIILQECRAGKGDAARGARRILFGCRLIEQHYKVFKLRIVVGVSFHPQVIFPEGTRSRTGGLQPFKDGFFRLALEQQCQILPMVLHNSTSLWPIGDMLLDAGTVYVAFGDPVHIHEGMKLEELKEIVRNQMLDLQRQCPLFDAEKDKPLTEMAKTRGQGLVGGKSEHAEEKTD